MSSERVDVKTFADRAKKKPPVLKGVSRRKRKPMTVEAIESAKWEAAAECWNLLKFFVDRKRRLCAHCQLPNVSGCWWSKADQQVERVSNKIVRGGWERKSSDYGYDGCWCCDCCSEVEKGEFVKRRPKNEFECFQS